MNSPTRILYDFIQLCLSFQERLEPYRLSLKSVEQLFAWLDKRRRGFIDVSDFYEKFSELQEDQLFFVFKTLDVSRTGLLTLNDLKDTVMCDAPIENNPDFQKTFRGYIRLLTASYHSLQAQKTRMGLRSETIKTCFQIVSMGKIQISVEDLARSFTHNGLPVERRLINYLSKHIFQNGFLKEQQFTKIFAPMNENTIEMTENKAESYLQQKQKRVDGTKGYNFYSREKVNSKIVNNREMDNRIDEILKKYEKFPRKSYQQSNSQNQENFYIQKPSLPFTYTHQNRLKTYDHETNEISSPEFGRPTSAGYEHILEYQQKNSVPESRTEGLDFQRRRQQLRRGSLQRQKIIDDVLVRRKKNEQWGENVHKYRDNGIYDNEKSQSDPITEFSSNIRPQSASKLMNKTNTLNSTSMNWHGSYSKPDLRLFYKNTGQNLTKNYTYEKENILKRAEHEAAKKIQEIERKARLKVMQKRSANGVYSRWLK